MDNMNRPDHPGLDHQVCNELKEDDKAEEYLRSGQQGQVDIRSAHVNLMEQRLGQTCVEDPWTIYTAESTGKKD